MTFSDWCLELIFAHFWFRLSTIIDVVDATKLWIYLCRSRANKGVVSVSQVSQRPQKCDIWDVSEICFWYKYKISFLAHRVKYESSSKKELTEYLRVSL
jgi:hypothetical protein